MNKKFKQVQYKTKNNYKNIIKGKKEHKTGKKSNSLKKQLSATI